MRCYILANVSLEASVAPRKSSSKSDTNIVIGERNCQSADSCTATKLVAACVPGTTKTGGGLHTSPSSGLHNLSRFTRELTIKAEDSVLYPHRNHRKRVVGGFVGRPKGYGGRVVAGTDGAVV